jgi:hypothetical protein
MNKYIFLLTIILLALGIPTAYKTITRSIVINPSEMLENYENINDKNAANLEKTTNASNIEKDILLTDSYPWTGRNGISNNDANSIWWHYPIFELGSYDQITNNIRYPNNPDEGTCMPASMCGALYKEKQLKTNYIKQLPPVNPNCGTRVGYFTTGINLLPFRTDVPNILY